MKKKTAIFAAVAALICGCASDNNTSKSINQEEVIGRLSTADKAHFVVGTYMERHSDSTTFWAYRNLVPGAAGTIHALDSLGIPTIVLADGPAGLRIRPTREGDTNTYYCTHFPIATLLASTWNAPLVRQVGASIGQEVKEYGVDVLLAPAINIMRNPLCGRNFEYYSEDPVVTGLTAAAYIQGVQSNGVGTSVKHFAANSQETNRMKNDARISQRALREIYLKGFEIAIKQGNPWTVMTSYNLINGTYTSESKDLLTTILRDEWNYEGTVMTDWFGGNDGALQMWAGNDMLQPGTPKQYDSIVSAVASGKLAEADLDRSVGRLLSLIEKTPRFQGYDFSNSPDLTAHAAVTRQSAAEGMVLMKNDNSTLPLTNGIKNVALYGNTSYQFIAGGTGSGTVHHAYVVSLLDGLTNGGFSVNQPLRKTYEQFWADYKAQYKKEIVDDGDLPLPAERLFSSAELDAHAAQSDVAIITLGRICGEGDDRPEADFLLSSSEQQLLNQVCSAFHKAGKKVVVLLNIGSVIETASWKSLPDAILCAWQAGQEGGNSVADVLSGRQSPSGKFTMTWPVKLSDIASTRNFPLNISMPQDEFDRNLGNTVRNVDFTDYEEDVYVGYRYFDAFNVPVSYPFGFGLSYTTFEYSNAAIKQKGDAFEVSVSVKNSGSHEGKEVVQLYVAAPDSKSHNKPVKELKAYAKTRLLKPGESETLVLTVKAADLASFDGQASAWVVDGGEYQFLVAASSQDIRATLTASVKAQTMQVHNVMKPQHPLHLLQRQN